MLVQRQKAAQKAMWTEDQFLALLGRKWPNRRTPPGLAKAFDLAGLSGQTCTGMMAGTPSFMPRQQVVDFRYAKPEVDVWAAAASLYFMLTAYYPRDFPRGIDPWQRVLQTDPIPIRQRQTTIPRKLADLLDHALHDHPDIPFKSAAGLRGELEAIL